MIVSEKRDADEQKKTVEADQEKIGKEAAECNKVAADAKADLDVAMPALEKAMKEVDKLNKGDVAEVKNYKQPPGPVELTLSAVMVLFISSNALKRIRNDFDGDGEENHVLPNIDQSVVLPEAK